MYSLQINKLSNAGLQTEKSKQMNMVSQHEQQVYLGPRTLNRLMRQTSIPSMHLSMDKITSFFEKKYMNEKYVTILSPI